jgi:hypothetical protein
MDPKRVDIKQILRKRQSTNRSEVFDDNRYINIPHDVELEGYINDIWEELRRLRRRQTTTVKEAELKYNRRNHKDRIASMVGEVGQFRLKEISNPAKSNAIEICNQESWQTLAARLPDLDSAKVNNLAGASVTLTSSTISSGDSPTEAEHNQLIADVSNIKDNQDQIFNDIKTLKSKINLLVKMLSKKDVFNLEDIPDENPHVDRDVVGKSVVK